MIINGIASIKGIGSSGATATFSGVAATIKPVRATYSKTHDVEELKDGEGDVVALGANNVQQRAQLELIVTGADIATAKSLEDPAPLATVTLANFNHAKLNGTWNYREGWQVVTGPDFAKISMVCSRVGGSALSAAS